MGNEEYGLTERRASFLQRFNEGQSSSYSTNLPARPHTEPPDLRGLLGSRKYSPEVARHNRQLLNAYFEATRADFLTKALIALEISGLGFAVQGIEVEEGIVMSTTPGTLTASIAEGLMLTSAARIRDGITRIQTNFVDRALEGR